MLKLFLKPIAIILSALIVSGIIGGVLIYRSGVDKENSGEDNSNISDDTSQSVSADKRVERPLCVLIIGKDKVSSLADVIMLASFDKSTKKTFILQIPRDTYADYGASYYKINGALRALGEEGMCRFFEDSMGIEIDGYISLELEGFRALVDSIGGVEMNIPRRLRYSDPEQGLYIDLPAGMQTLDGKQAEMLVRYRSGYARGDLDRLDMQKRFLAAFFVQLKERITPFNVYSIVSAAFPYLKTNISATELVSLGLNAISVQGEDISIATISGEDAISAISGGSFYVVCAESASELLIKYFRAEYGSFDKNRCFLHPTLDTFKKIYQKKVENKVFSVNELK
jgi:LCP family protein required for cell wall assembly